MSPIIAQISVAEHTSPAMLTDYFFVYMIFEWSVFFFLNEVQKIGAFVIRRFRFPTVIYAAVRYGIMSVTNSDPAISLNSHAL